LLLYKATVGSCGPVLIVDDDASLRELVGSLLLRAGFASREAGSAEEALKQAEEETPSVVIVDVDLGGGKSGYELYHELRERISELPAVFVSGTRTEAFDRAAGSLLGADHYIVKPFDPDELLGCVRSLVEREMKRHEARAADLAHFSTLTARQLEVLRLLAVGRSQKEIARILGLSSKTIATHIQYILTKLDLHSRAQAVAKAHSSGLMAWRNRPSDVIMTSTLTTSG
jgi:DNA-binding NarL/FixJ family response regulator